MAQLINVSINITKVDMNRIVKGKNGEYLNLTLSVNDQKDRFDNDVSVWQSQTKEERENKANRNFLGDGRKVWEG